jgi:hypothetical protein
MLVICIAYFFKKDNLQVLEYHFGSSTFTSNNFRISIFLIVYKYDRIKDNTRGCVVWRV